MIVINGIPLPRPIEHFSTSSYGMPTPRIYRTLPTSPSRTLPPRSLQFFFSNPPSPSCKALPRPIQNSPCTCTMMRAEEPRQVEQRAFNETFYLVLTCEFNCNNCWLSHTQFIHCFRSHSVCFWLFHLQWILRLFDSCISCSAPFRFYCLIFNNVMADCWASVILWRFPHHFDVRSILLVVKYFSFDQILWWVWLFCKKEVILRTHSGQNEPQFRKVSQFP